VRVVSFLCDGEKMVVRFISSWAAACLAIVMIACDRGEEKKDVPRADTAPANSSKQPASTWGPATSAGFFTEITKAVGLEDKPPAWPDGFFVIPELTPGGVALFDFDNDGRLDILAICHPPPSEDQFRR
jgi:hypothetical protein